MGIFFSWIIFSFVVGLIGSGRKIGFFGALFVSLLLSPLIGLIFTLISKTDEDEKYKKKILEAQKSQEESLKILSSSNTFQKISIADEIEKLQKLKNSNSITEEEFIKLKNRIIDSNLDYENTDIDFSEDVEANLSNSNTINPLVYGNPILKEQKPNLLTAISIVVCIILIILLINTLH